MQPIEALTRVIAMADYFKHEEGGHPDPDRQAQDDLAVSICQAMLNTAIPVARFRCFIRIESGKYEGTEFTVCSSKIEDIQASLDSIRRYPMVRSLYVSLWEQRATGADMLVAFQGKSRTKTHGRLDQFGDYINELDKYKVELISDAPQED